MLQCGSTLPPLTDMGQLLPAACLLCLLFAAGSLMVENIQGPQLNGFQGIYPVNHLGQGYPVGLPPGTSQQPKPPHSTLAQLQMQVEKLAKQQPPTAPLAPPPHWSWSQSVPLPRPPSIRPPRSSAPQGFHPMPQQGRGFMPPHYHQMSPIGAMKSPGSPSQVSAIHCPVTHLAMESELGR